MLFLFFLVVVVFLWEGSVGLVYIVKISNVGKIVVGVIGNVDFF